VAFKFPTKKNDFFQTSFFLLLSLCTFTSVFKDNKVLKKSQNSRNQGFLNFFANYGSGPGRPRNLQIRIWKTPEISTKFLHHTKEIFALGQLERGSEFKFWLAFRTVTHRLLEYCRHQRPSRLEVMTIRLRWIRRFCQQCCRFWMFIPDPNFSIPNPRVKRHWIPNPGSETENWNIPVFNPNNCY
jgi:hypothetical protein